MKVSSTTLYGTAWSGGTAGRGTVFKLNTDGTGFAVLHHFGTTTNNDRGHDCNPDGAWIESGLVLSGGVLYGAAAQGGVAGNGTVFKLSTNGTGFALLHRFSAHGGSYPDNTNQDGENPTSLVLSGRALYGVASNNGRRYGGTVFRVDEREEDEPRMNSDARTKTAAGASAILWAAVLRLPCQSVSTSWIPKRGLQH